MSEKKTGPKENLTWKINYLAAQVGETTHMKTAIIAASRAKYHKIHSSEDPQLDQTSLKNELYTARKLKLESKLHQARKDIKAALKKAKHTEVQKQTKKIKSARKLLEESSSEDKVEEKREVETKKDKEEVENGEANKDDVETKKGEEKKPKKKVTAEEIEQYENELKVLNKLDLDALIEKTIKNKLLKNPTLKNEELIKDLIESCIKPIDKPDQITQNIESRLISQKPVITGITNNISSFQSIILGNNDKIQKRKANELKKKAMEEKKKRKAEEAEKDKLNKKPKVTATTKTTKQKAGTSEFMETLGDMDDENDDENFAKIYEGEKKPNRVGQKQRRKQWEEKYGREANHIAAEFKKREEKRLANPDYKPKKKPTPRPAASAVSNAPSEPVHPSWEAKRIQEEIMSKALSGKGGPSNNKIVFDDSD